MALPRIPGNGFSPILPLTSTSYAGCIFVGFGLNDESDPTVDGAVTTPAGTYWRVTGLGSGASADAADHSGQYVELREDGLLYFSDDGTIGATEFSNGTETALLVIGPAFSYTRSASQVLSTRARCPSLPTGNNGRALLGLVDSVPATMVHAGIGLRDDGQVWRAVYSLAAAALTAGSAAGTELLVYTTGAGAAADQLEFDGVAWDYSSRPTTVKAAVQSLPLGANEVRPYVGLATPSGTASTASIRDWCRRTTSLWAVT